MPLSSSVPRVLSILIATIPSRERQFLELTRKLHAQIASAGLEDRVEIVHFLDDCKLTIGAKRNALLDQAGGEFTAFVDDDDDVSDDYVPSICRAIDEHPEIDCVGIKATIFFRGRQARTMIFSLKNRCVQSKGGVYLRPPVHLNPMRREIAARYRFEDSSLSEDFDWAMRICRDGALHREHFLDEVVYYYLSRRHWFYQWLLDRSERLRHVFGLQLVNRIKVRRWIRSWIGKFSGALRHDSHYDMRVPK